MAVREWAVSLACAWIFALPMALDFSDNIREAILLNTVFTIVSAPIVYVITRYTSIE